MGPPRSNRGPGVHCSPGEDFAVPPSMTRCSSPPSTATPGWHSPISPLPTGSVGDWAVRPDCGAVVVFSGTARNHAEGRPDVQVLEDQAYDEQVVPLVEAIVAETRRRWPSTGRLAALHRTGRIAIGESSVLVAASSPHRDDVFHPARFCIDTLKSSVPIWKRETWAGGPGGARRG